MRLAEHLRFAGSLAELMDRVPYREYRMWMARLDELWNSPSRSDYYVMKLMNIVLSAFGGGETDLDKLRVRFGEKVKDPTIKSQAYVNWRMEEARKNAEGWKPGMSERPTR